MLFSPWKIRVRKAVLRVLMSLASLVDVVLFDVLQLKSAAVLRWWLRPESLRRKAVGLSGVSEEKYHVSIEEMDKRLERSVEAVAAMDETKKLRCCGPNGGTLGIGFVTIRTLERRLVRQLVVDLLVTTRKAQNKVESPLVIVGPQRSGTTVLLELLGCDKESWRQLKTHETILPVETTSWRLIEIAHEWLAGTELVLDQVKHIHHERWDGPAECRAALENGVGAPYVLWYIFGATDSLDKWLPDDDLRFHNYRFYKEQLSVLSDSSRQVWLLKDPAHCFSLDALFAAFPKATVVWTHREPEKVAGSLCSLMRGIWAATLREDPSSSSSDGPPNYSAAVVEYLAIMLDRAVDYRVRHPEARIIDVAMDDIREDPMNVIDNIYAFANKPLSPQARAAMLDFLGRDATTSKKIQHSYHLTDFGLDLSTIRSRFQKYTNAPFFPLRHRSV